MDKWFGEMAAEFDLPEEMVRQLRDVGYVVIEGPVAQSECAQLAEAYDAAVRAAHPDDVSIKSSTRVHDFVNRGQHFDGLYIYRPLLASGSSIFIPVPATGRNERAPKRIFK